MKTMTMQLKFMMLLAFVVLNGCAYSIHEVHTSDFMPYAQIERGEIVKARKEQFVVLGFTSETDYVDQAYTELMAKCPSGSLSGITTQLSTDLGFFSWTNVALMQGLCVNTASSKTKKSAKTESSQMAL